MTKFPSLYEEIQKLETELIMRALTESRNVAHAAKKLKVNRTTLVEKMRKLGIKVERQERLVINDVTFKEYPK